MPGPTVIERLVADVGRQIRLRRAEFYGLRGVRGITSAGSLYQRGRALPGALGASVQSLPHPMVWLECDHDMDERNE